jgi:hypothetical protein
VATSAGNTCFKRADGSFAGVCASIVDAPPKNATAYDVMRILKDRIHYPQGEESPTNAF